MAGTIVTITDREKFQHILDTYFARTSVYLRTKSGDLNIQYLGFSEGNAAFRIPRVKNCPDMLLILTRHGDSTIYATLKYVENNEDTFIFMPVKFQIISGERREARTSLPIEGNDKNVIFLSNLMTDFLMQNCLMANEKKLDNIKESLKYDLEQKFERVRIVFMHESKTDPRLKHIQMDYVPIFIPDIGEKPDEKNEQAFNYYINEIYSKDFKLNSDKTFISEATVPILYRSIIPYGYIQVNNRRPMTEGYLTVTKRMAIVVSEYFRKEAIFPNVKDRFLVSDLSARGLGVVFRDRRLTRYFRQGGLVSCDLMLPTNKKVMIGAVVRNMLFNDNGIIKVGFELKNIDALSQVNYEEYLESLGVSTD
ncbi:MAG: hypothetical protein JXA20_08175 [Spirochaetes bacterium]|nr:hypothetical protein [Spirochaetota bacterium]